MSASDDSTRPLSVADLLARNGTIGSPPVGGRRRRRRRNSDGLSVAELTGEIPVIRTGEIPVVGSDASAEESVEESVEEYVEEYVEADSGAAEAVSERADEVVYGQADEVVYGQADEVVYEVAGEEAVSEVSVHEDAVYEDVVYEDVVHEDVVHGAAVYEDVVYEDVVYEDVGSEKPVAESSETVVVYTSAEVPEYVSEYTSAEVPEYVAEVAAAVEVEASEAAQPPLASDPLPRRSDVPERSYDPRPVRRSSGAEQMAEQMAYDPVDESVNLDDLVDEHVEDVEQLRSYLRASKDTLFSGGTVADDLARRGIAAEEDETDQAVATVSGPARPRQVGSTLWNSVLAVVQSLMAVVLGAGLFIGFDQLWRWNNLVALILSVLVVLTLAAGVRFVRKTEDIVSTLTAVAVGLLVTLGPLALQST